MAVPFRAGGFRAPRACLVALVLSLFAAADSQASTIRVALGGGLRAPLNSEQRDNYDSETTFSLSVAGPISSGDVWVYAEMGYGTAKGDPFGSDRTFSMPRARYRWMPIVMGFRANTVPEERRKDLALYIGVGGVIGVISLDPPFGASESSSTTGILLEFRPELNLKNGWGLWARDRLALLAGNRFESANAPDMNLTGNGVEFGISRRFGGTEGDLR